ncbi:MAG: sigma-70 family RNA polymerase sigma factor [Opitutus sp.]|nr:sigma-70 family RNA polymerase sigma factor [Opitutus sp.]
MLSCLPEGLADAAVRAGASAAPRRLARMTNLGSTESIGERALTDARLMARVSQGDRDAFAQLYDRFSGALYGTAIRVVGDAAEAQDIVHDAFISLWNKAVTFDSARGNAFSWAVTLVRNRAIDRVRSRRRRAELLAEAAPSDLGYSGDRSGTSGSEALDMGEDARAIRTAVATLPEEQQRALELAFFGGLTQEQIAANLRTPLGTVKARIRRGLLKLRESLARRP